jgi:hypothetical protein
MLQFTIHYGYIKKYQKLNYSYLKLHKLGYTEVQQLYQVLSYAQVQEHYIIWQPASHFSQAILHDARPCSAHHYVNLLRIGIHTFQLNALLLILGFYLPYLRKVLADVPHFTNVVYCVPKFC